MKTKFGIGFLLILPKVCIVSLSEHTFLNCKSIQALGISQPVAGPTLNITQSISLSFLAISSSVKSFFKELVSVSVLPKYLIQDKLLAFNVALIFSNSSKNIFFDNDQLVHHLLELVMLALLVCYVVHINYLDIHI